MAYQKFTNLLPNLLCPIVLSTISVSHILSKYLATLLRPNINNIHTNINNIQVHKIKHYYIIKVVCEDTETADAVIRDGLFAFHTKIAASQCKKEQFTEPITCFRCYKFEDHFSSDCKTTQIICSECAQVGHTHRDCHAVEKRCINCPPGQNFHRTLAPFCPVRKDANAQKQQKLKNASEIQNNKHCENNNQRNNTPGQTCHTLDRKAPPKICNSHSGGPYSLHRRWETIQCNPTRKPQG